MDRKDSVEGPPDATVTVEALRGKDVSWTIHEPGERGDVVTNHLYVVTNNLYVVTNNLYKVTKYSNGETANIYTYFSLADGRKVRTNQYAELSRDELETLDILVAKSH
jgi:hypothetical protein